MQDGTTTTTHMLEPKVKRSTGIPYSFMTPVSGPEIKGALLTNQGHYAVPTHDMSVQLSHYFYVIIINTQEKFW